MFAAVVAATFVIVAIVFFVYDLFVQRRNENLVSKAAHFNALISSIFPTSIRKRLMDEKEETQQGRNSISSRRRSGNLKAFLNKGGDDGDDLADTKKPMADLFLETTVLFADISGT